jgi:hypothetical protein
MPKLIITHAVADVSNWLKPEHKEERAAAIGKMGGSSVQDFVAQDGSSAVAVSTEVEDVAALLATLAAPPDDMKAVMASHGVQPPFAVYVAK